MANSRILNDFLNYSSLLFSIYLWVRIFQVCINDLNDQNTILLQTAEYFERIVWWSCSAQWYFFETRLDN